MDDVTVLPIEHALRNLCDILGDASQGPMPRDRHDLDGG